MRTELVHAVPVHAVVLALVLASPARAVGTPAGMLPPGHPRPPELELRLKALEQLDARDLPGALASTDALVAAAPRSSEAWRFAFFVRRGLGQWAEAEAAISEAVQWAPDATSAAALLTERAGLRRQRGQLSAAEDDVAAVLQEAPTHPEALALGVQVALAQGELERARRRLQVLEGVAGDALPLLRAYVLAGEGEPGAALAWARRAALGPEPQAAEARALVARLEETAVAGRTRPVVRALALLGGLLAGLGLWLAAVLLPLSRRARRRLRGHGAAGDGRAAQVPVGPTRAEALALRVGAHGVGGLVRLLPLGLLALVAWPVAALSAVGPRPEWSLALLALAVPALATLAAWGRALRTRAFTVDLGPALALDAHPALAAELAEAARAAGAAPPSRVHLAADASLHAFESGPLWRVLLGRGEWTLVLGLARLAGTPRGELRALLVEALGPAGGEGLLRQEGRAALALRLLGEALHRQPLAVANPFFHALSLLSGLYESAREGVREAALAAVEVRAARSAGGAALVAGRARGMQLRGAHDRVANRLVPLLVRAGHGCEDLYRWLPACSEVPAPASPARPAAEPEDVLPDAVLLSLERQGGAVPAAEVPAVELLPEAGAHARELTRAWVERLQRGLAAASVRVAPAGAPVSEEQQDARVLTLARFDAALARRRSGAEDAEREVGEALAALEAQVGARDALLGLALKELALAQALRGERAQAVRTLERALQAEGARRFRGLLEEWQQVA